MSLLSRFGMAFAGIVPVSIKNYVTSTTLHTEGTRVIARFVLTEDEEIEDTREDEFLDLRSHRKNTTKGPHTF